MYIDDFYIYNTQEAHLQRVRENLTQFHKLGGQLNSHKCHVGEDEETLPGHKVSQRGIQVDLDF